VTAELLMTPPGSDTSSDVARVVEATRHLHDFRTGFATTLETLALRSTEYMPEHGKAHLEAMLRVLGAERAQRLAERLYRIASDITAGWQPHVDIDDATEALHRVIHEAVNAVMAELYRDACVCREATR
jgi:hypothetical protein